MTPLSSDTNKALYHAFVVKARLEGKDTPAGWLLGEQLRVLMAEDTPVNQAVTKRLLERLEGIVEVVPEGEEGLKSFES